MGYSPWGHSELDMTQPALRHVGGDPHPSRAKASAFALPEPMTAWLPAASQLGPHGDPNDAHPSPLPATLIWAFPVAGLAAGSR